MAKNTDFTEANRQYFDKMASTYKDEFADSLKLLSNMTLEHRNWISGRWTDTTAEPGQEIKMLEYACGPGHISMTLAPFLDQIVGFDVSTNMVEEFNRNAATLGLTEKAIGHECDLLAETVAPEFNGPVYNDFDLVTVSMALHHFEHPDRALKRLGERVKDGGVCFIIDLVASSGHGHGHEHGHGHNHGHDHAHGHKHETDFGEAAHTVKTHGFSEETMKNLFEEAGFTSGFKYEVAKQPLKFTKNGKDLTMTTFFSRAQRPSN